MLVLEMLKVEFFFTNGRFSSLSQDLPISIQTNEIIIKQNQNKHVYLHKFWKKKILKILL
jgi:hypothetical protein